MGSSSVPHYNPPDMPKFIPADVGSLNQQAIGYDVDAYRRSDEDFALRFPEIQEAQRLLQGRILSDFQTSAPTQALRDEMMRGGISNALSAFGGTITPGSAAEASVARNLGIGIMDFQDRNRANQNQGMLMASQLFQPRTFGFGGQGALQLELANLEGQNAFNQANYAAQVAGGQFNAGIDARNQNARNQSTNSTMAAVGSAASAAAVGAVVCWLAREAFGHQSYEWKRFRKWMIESSPLWIFNAYLRYGRKSSILLKYFPIFKPAVRAAMRIVT